MTHGVGFSITLPFLSTASFQINVESSELLTFQKQSQWKSPRKHWIPHWSVGGSKSAGLVFQLQLCMYVFPPGRVLESFLSLLGGNIVLFCSLVASGMVQRIWRHSKHSHHDSCSITGPGVLPVWLVCHLAGCACAVLLYISQTGRGAPRAMHSLIPLLLLPPRFFLLQDSRRKDHYGFLSALSWRNRGDKHWIERCVPLILPIPQHL